MTRFRFIALIVVGVACAPPSIAQKEPQVVKLMTVEVPSTQVTRQFFGKAVARQTVDLAFQTSGQIVLFPVIEGSTIKRGELIAQFDLEPFRLAVEQAQLRRDQAKRRTDRLRKLQGGAASRENYEDAVTEANLAEVALRKSERDLENATLYAPFEALVANRKTANFATVRAGDPVVRLHDMSELRIEIEVPEILFQRAGRDQGVSIDAIFPAIDAKYPVEVREYTAETSRIGQTYRVTLGMKPPEELIVLPGSSVTILATLNDAERRIHLPSTAVATAADGTTSVMVFKQDSGDEGTLSAQPVGLEVGRDGSFRVVSGLEPGTRIVAAGASSLRDGDRVKWFQGFAN